MIDWHGGFNSTEATFLILCRVKEDTLEKYRVHQDLTLHSRESMITGGTLFRPDRTTGVNPGQSGRRKLCKHSVRQ